MTFTFRLLLCNGDYGHWLLLALPDDALRRVPDRRETVSDFPLCIFRGHWLLLASPDDALRRVLDRHSDFPLCIFYGLWLLLALPDDAL